MLTLYTCKLEETAFPYAMYCYYGMELNLQHPTNHFNELFKQKLSSPDMCVCVWREKKSYVWILLVHDKSIHATKGRYVFSCTINGDQ